MADTGQDAGGSARAGHEAGGPRQEAVITRADAARREARDWRAQQDAVRRQLGVLRGQEGEWLVRLAWRKLDLERTPPWRVLRRAGLRAEIAAGSKARDELAAGIAEYEASEWVLGDHADQAEAMAAGLDDAERAQARAAGSRAELAAGWVRRAAGRLAGNLAVTGAQRGRAAGGQPARAQPTAPPPVRDGQPRGPQASW
jgi:hypothetical protein